jgi:hypothetical protein
MKSMGGHCNQAASTLVTSERTPPTKAESTLVTSNANPKPATTGVAKAANTIEEFCESNSISRAFYYKLKKLGQGPDIMWVGAKPLITTESAAAWRRRMMGEA